MGDLLLNPRTEGYSRVEQVVQGPEKEVVEIRFDAPGGSTSSKLSFEHVMVTKRGYIRALDVVKGDELRYRGGSWVSVLEVQKVPAHKVVNFVLNPNSQLYEDHLVESDGLVTGDLWLQNNLKTKQDR